jgi:polysaccharide biosynthesis protein PslG
VTFTPLSSGTRRAQHGKAATAIVTVVVVMLAGVGVGIAIGRSHTSSSSTATVQPGGRKVRPCTKRRRRLHLCPQTSQTTVPGGFGSSDASAPPGSLPSLALTDLHSKMGLSTGTQLWSSTASQIDSQISGIGAAGAKWLRTALHWSDVEPASVNQDDWSRADRIVTDTQKDGINVIFDITNAPGWAGKAQAGEFGSDPHQYATFAAKVAARYRNTVRVFELGNEPNHVNYVANPDPATYASLLRLAYPEIKAADPNAFVLVGGIGGVKDSGGDIDPVSFVRGLYQNGAKGYFDGLSYHPYTYPELPTQEISTGDRGWSRMLTVRSIMVQNGDASKPIWVTEFGAPTNGPGGVSQQQQAAILQNGFQLWNSYSWGGAICWFSYQNKGTDPTTHKDWFGLIDATGAHNASYATYTALAQNS